MNMRDLNPTQTDEIRNRTRLADDKHAGAELLRDAAGLFDDGGEETTLAEALTKQGVALARTGHREQARLTLQRAVEIADRAGDRESAGRAAITIIEELGDELLDDELLSIYARADNLLRDTRYPETHRRLLRCVRIILFLMGAAPEPPSWERFSFDRVRLRYEASIIDRALRDAGGLISRAAQLLGIKRQRLSSMLHTRHRRLLFRHQRAASSISFERALAGQHIVTVLCVEDSPTVAEAVRDSLEAEGWRVQVCADYDAARDALEGVEKYDLLLFDYMLPGGNGVSLTRLARGLMHRRRTPILMLTASEVEAEAWRAGVSAFLRKPQEIVDLYETAARLLGEDKDGKRKG